MRKVWNLIKRLTACLIVCVTVCVMIFTIISVTTLDRSDSSIFGYKGYIVLSDSMSATDFDAGDLILVKEVDPSALEVGDIVAYIFRGEGNYGEIVTHKIRTRVTNGKGEQGFITYGTTTGIDDELVVEYSDIQGKYLGRIPKAGFFFRFLKTVPGYIIFILIPFLILILWQAVGCAKTIKEQRSEQITEWKTEREKLEKERIQLLALKARMGDGSGQHENVQGETGGNQGEEDRR